MFPKATLCHLLCRWLSNFHLSYSQQTQERLQCTLHQIQSLVKQKPSWCTHLITMGIMMQPFLFNRLTLFQIFPPVPILPHVHVVKTNNLPKLQVRLASKLHFTKQDARALAKDNLALHFAGVTTALTLVEHVQHLQVHVSRPELTENMLCKYLCPTASSLLSSARNESPKVPGLI